METLSTDNSPTDDDIRSLPAILPNVLVREARRVLQMEAEALRVFAETRVDESFVRAVELLLRCEGRVVVTGMGKSGIVGRKIAATLASTGTPAYFLHPAEAIHGDLGIVASCDVVVALSYSGETDELTRILPILRQRAAHIVALTGNAASSTLARIADVSLNVHIEREACPHNLAPTTSTTLMLAVGDALAVALMHARDFSAAQYAVFHPGGSLGRRLLLRVYDIMRRGNDLAVVGESVSLHDALFAITKAQAGAACVVGGVTDGDGTLVGIVTDGDVRRFLLAEGADALAHPVADAMHHNPRRIAPDSLAYDVVEQFSRDARRTLGELPVVDADDRPIGMLTLKDLVRAGIITGPPDGND